MKELEEKAQTDRELKGPVSAFLFNSFEILSVGSSI
jgi:hypothetical protein